MAGISTPPSGARSALTTNTRPSKAAVKSIATITYPAGTTVWRCHSRKDGSGNTLGPWYYSNRDGRFNLRRQYGTLNVALDPWGAVCEAMGSAIIGDDEVDPAFVAAKRLVRLALPRDVEVLDLYDSSAQKAGIVTAELAGASNDYSPFRELARHLHAGGATGLHSPLRFSAFQGGEGLYLFGKEGARTWKDGVEEDIVALLASHNYVMRGAPSAAALGLT